MRSGVLFHFPRADSARVSNYHHCELALAEGFRELKIPVFGTRAYWQNHPSGEFTIPLSPPGFAPDIHIHSAYWSDDLSSSANPFQASGLHVVLDWNDGDSSWLAGHHADGADLILRSHFTTYLGYPAKVRPWAFGLTNRLIEALYIWPVSPPLAGINWNFRHDHNLRRLIRRRIPMELLHHHPLATQFHSMESSDDWLQRQTRGRHHPDYFNDLHHHHMTAAFGGNFRMRGRIPRNLRGRIIRRIRTDLIKLQLRLQRKTTYELWLDFVEAHPQTYHVIQFDSWRWWETLLSASVPLHLDFESQGWQLPVMPVNGQHYLGLRNWDYAQYSHDILSRDAASFHMLANAGRKWALEHYSPVASATRLLGWLELSTNAHRHIRPRSVQKSS